MQGAVLMGALLGGALGAGVGVAAHLKRAHESRQENLGYEWRHALADPHLKAALCALRAFRHADEEAYARIGDACDALVSLWFTVSDTHVRRHQFWPYKSFQYRMRVEDTLRLLGERVEHARRAARQHQTATRRLPEVDTAHSKQGTFSQRLHDECATGGSASGSASATSKSSVAAGERNYSMRDFAECADTLCVLVRNYHDNIVSEMRYRRDDSTTTDNASAYAPEAAPDP